MNQLPRLFKIGLGLFLGSFLLLFGFYNSYFSTHTNKQQIKSEIKAKPVNWLEPTGGTYPVIGLNDSIWIKVSKEEQKVYIITEIRLFTQ